ncbi:MAG: HAMP domain-containing protein [Deltaproteobacteria bacterium]|nr:HAMP domain-containing protein [Deltaproteobacteria bacterium]
MRLSLATKIFIGFSVVLAVFGTVTVYGVTRFSSVRQKLSTVNRGYLPLDRIAASIETLQETTRRSVDGILRFDNVDLQRSLLVKNRRSFSRNMTSKIERAMAILQKLESQPISEREQSFLVATRDRFERMQQRTDEIATSLELILQGLDQLDRPAGETDGVRNLRKNERQLARDVRLLKLALKNMISTQMLRVEEEDSESVGVILWLTVLALLVSTAVTAASLWAMRPIRRLAEAARRISQGDFAHTVEVSSKDEFGFLASEFNRMARSLAQREDELRRQQGQLESINLQLRQSSIDLELITLFYEHIIRSIHNGILVVNALGEVTTVNPAAEQIFELSSDAISGQRLDSLPFAASMSALLESWERVLQRDEPILFEALEFVVPSRGQILVDLYAAALRDARGERQGVLLVCEDVTERVRTKQALLQSERMATIGRMSALVAHEIRNPLSSIGLNTELLQEEIEQLPSDATAEASAILSSISREVERLTEVTDEYLRFARVPRPNLVPERLNQILEDLLRFLKSELDDAGIEIKHDLDPDVTTIPADENQLRQAFLNLIKNSADSMSTGGTLTISTERTDGQIHVRISDTGEGIAEERIGRIFDPFFSTRDGGTGLGLSLTQQIVSEHGGSISCESKPGQGTVFVVHLPTSQSPGEEPS